MNNATIPFTKLHTTDVVNLYVPEQRYGFSTQPDVATEELVFVAPAVQTVDPRPAPSMAVASNVPAPAMLPQTASKTPLLALGGLLLLLSGFVLTLRRIR